MKYYKIGGLGQSVKQIIELFSGGGVGYLAGNAQVIQYNVGDTIRHAIEITKSEFESLLEDWKQSVGKDQPEQEKSQEDQRGFEPLTKYSLDSPTMQIEGYSARDRNALCNFLARATNSGFVVLDKQGVAIGFVNANVAKEASYIFEDVE